MTDPQLPKGLGTGELNFPFDEVCRHAEALATAGALVFQKYSCEECHARLTMEERNTFYTQGSCDQCGHITDIRATGCNFLLVWLAPAEEDTSDQETGRR